MKSKRQYYGYRHNRTENPPINETLDRLLVPGFRWCLRV